jgi:hypothetical protein
MRAKAAGKIIVGVLGVVLAVSGFVAQGCGGGGASSACTTGSEGCPCTTGGGCDPGLECKSSLCVDLGGGGAGTGGNSTDPNVACADITKYCDKLYACAPLLVNIAYGSKDVCATREKISCKDALTAPDTGLTAKSIADCGTALADATCSDVIYRLVPACQVKGKRDDGGACGTDEQCKSGHCTQNDSACGVCAPLVKAGNTCEADADCEAGLICSDDGHCVRPVAGGSACTANQPCTYGYYCNLAGSCVATTDEPGGQCAESGSCNLLLNLFCTAGKTCKSISFAANGATCGAVGSDIVLCGGGDCAGDPNADTGVCAARAKDGETCGSSSTNGRDCQAPATCVQGHCKTPSSSACL